VSILQINRISTWQLGLKTSAACFAPGALGLSNNAERVAFWMGKDHPYAYGGEPLKMVSDDLLNLLLSHGWFRKLTGSALTTTCLSAKSSLTSSSHLAGAGSRPWQLLIVRSSLGNRLMRIQKLEVMSQFFALLSIAPSPCG
jgi:hypothetical protein